MHRRINSLFFIGLAVSLASLQAQNSRLNGTWKAPITLASGPGFFTYTFTVKDDTISGTLADPGESGKPIQNGKIVNGIISFDLGKAERYYTAELIDDNHLDLIEELHYNGYRMVRKPGSNAPANSLEGEWVLAKFLTITLHVNGDKLTGEGLDRDGVTHMPFTEGVVNGCMINFRYFNKGRPMRWHGALVGDHLEMISSLARPLHAVRVTETK